MQPSQSRDFTPQDSTFKIFHELMPRRIREILLVLSPFDAFIMEEDGSLATRIATEYKGLNLSNPPRMTQVKSAADALKAIRSHRYDLVITMPQVGDMDCVALGAEIKKIQSRLPVVLLAHRLSGLIPDPEQGRIKGIDHFFLWSPNPAFLLALVKSLEDRLNVDSDTRAAMVRVLILVEDSPRYRSILLPLIYREVVQQTQAVLNETINVDHRLLKMRARPKVLVAESYEQALSLYHRYQSYVFGIISDTRFRKKGQLDDTAGISLFNHVRQEIPDLPLLLLSAEPANRDRALGIPAVFLDKNDPDLVAGIHQFFLTHLGFGDFVFRLPDNSEIDRADTLAVFEKKLAQIPEESFIFHARRNHFSNWIMARSEIELASRLHTIRLDDSAPPAELRRQTIAMIHEVRRIRQQGVVGRFSPTDYDAQIMDFVKIGTGSMGGKALGLAFLASGQRHRRLIADFPGLPVSIPRTLVVTTDGFDSFIDHNHLDPHSLPKDDAAIAAIFLAAEMPLWLIDQLVPFLAQNREPLTVRSSSILEDAHFRPFAGLYSTYMLPNNQSDPEQRLGYLINAIKLVYASTYFAGPQAFARSTHSSGRQEGMAVIIQALTGRRHGDFFYPAVSGVARSYNYYPLGEMTPDDGIVNLALGFGKTVVEGEQSLRFSPPYPEHLPQFSTVDDMLANGQRFFYALKMVDYPETLAFSRTANLERREIDAAAGDKPVAMLTSSYLADEHRIRDSGSGGLRVVTFARILKHQMIPLPEVLTELLEIGRQGMGSAVEIEFAVDLPDGKDRARCHLLQIRPVAAGSINAPVRITDRERAQAFCSSSQALGNGEFRDIKDIILVTLLEADGPSAKETAREIGRINSTLITEKRPYILIGPGRWGSADPWLGIPVQWEDISGVSAIVECLLAGFNADASQGSHFFQNITAMGIPYLTVNELTDRSEDFLNREWLAGRPAPIRGKLVSHIRLNAPITIKIDGHTGQGILFTREMKKR